MEIIMFNSGLTQPEDRGIVLADIIECDFVDRDKAHCIDANYFKGGNPKSYFEKHRRQLVFCVGDNDRVDAISENERGYRPHRNDKAKSGISELGRILKPNGGKSDAVTTSHAPKLAVNNDVANLHYRKLTPRECFRLQTVPEHYIDKILDCGVSNSQLYKIAGNGWTDEVIAHILRCAKF